MSERILLAHGSGGRLAHDLIEKVLVKPLSNPLLDRLDDAAVLPGGGRLAFTTDSYVVQPMFFPGGDIGRLAVCGTVNDLSMVGATPLYLSLAFIIEEGLPVETLRRVARDGVLTPISALFPSTTSASVTTLNLGVPPARHGIYEWYMYVPAYGEVVQSLPFARLAGRMLAAAGSMGGQNRGEGSILGGLGNLLDGD